MLVSIVINNYNYASFLKDAIDSALNQAYSNIEVIVVDDGSTDDSKTIIYSYGERIRAILKNNGGQASAFNAGFAASRGEVICFLDSDDAFLPHKIESIVEIFTQHPNSAWCFHALKRVDLATQTTIDNTYRGESGSYDVTSDIKRGKLNGKLPFQELVTSGLCFRRALLQSILPMPEAINITSDDYLKYTALGTCPGYLLITELAIQRIHGNNAYTLRSDKKRLTARIHVLTAYWLRKNFPSLSRFANNLFVVGFRRYQETGGVEADYQDLIQKYFRTTPVHEKLELYAKNFYYRLSYGVKSWIHS